MAVPTIRRTSRTQVFIGQGAAGMWSGEAAITLIRGATASDEIKYTDGHPDVPNPALSDLTRKFWRDSVGGTEITDSDASWNVGDQTLEDIVTVSNLQTFTDGFTVDVGVDTSGVTLAALESAGLWDSANDRLGVIVSVEVQQPNK